MERKRLMSKEKKKKKEEETEINQSAQSDDHQELSELSDLEKAHLTISELEKQLQESKNDYLKAYADTQNMRKRMTADFENKSKFALKSFALEILSVIDNLQRAMADTKQDLESWRKGVDMIHKQLLDALKKEGIEKIDATGQPFDANKHHAIASEENDEVKPNTVIEVFQDGYMIKDKLLRPSVVKISERTSEENE